MEYSCFTIVILVSIVQQSKSAVCIHITIFFQISFPFRSPQSTESPVLYSRFSLVILYAVSVVYIRQSQSPNSSKPLPFLPQCPDTYSVCVSVSILQIRSSVIYHFPTAFAHFISLLYFVNSYNISDFFIIICYADLWSLMLLLWLTEGSDGS